MSLQCSLTNQSSPTTCRFVDAVNRHCVACRGPWLTCQVDQPDLLQSMNSTDWRASSPRPSAGHEQHWLESQLSQTICRAWTALVSEPAQPGHLQSMKRAKCIDQSRNSNDQSMNRASTDQSKSRKLTRAWTALIRAWTELALIRALTALIRACKSRKLMRAQTALIRAWTELALIRAWGETRRQISFLENDLQNV